MEIAFISSNKLKIEIDKGQGKLSGKILSRFLNTPSKFISALLLGNNIALVIYGIAIALVLDPFILNILPQNFKSEVIVFILQTIIATLIILIFAEFLPKALFRLNSNGILNFFAIPALIIYYIFYPFVIIFIGGSEWILKNMFKIRFTNEKYVFSTVDLNEYIKEFVQSDESTEDVQQEFQMFRNAIDFRNVKLRECMVPRTEIIAVEDTDTIDTLKEKFINYEISRILVYHDSIDNIIGYVHSFEMFKSPEHISDFLKPILIVPETMLANHVMTMFIQQHKSVALVVDEFGGTSGMVTMEDIIEEIFGEIEDEFDDMDMVEQRINDKEYVFSARLEIDYLNDKYNLDLPVSDEYETLAGLVIHYFESIPEVNETISIPPFIFHILEVSETRIEQVKLEIDES